MKNKMAFISTVLLALLALSACSGLVARPTVSSGSNAATQEAVIVQAVAATATTMAMETQIAQLQTQVAQGAATPIVVTATSEPVTSTETAPTEVPTATTAPAQPTALPTNTLVKPTATLIPIGITPVVATATPTATVVPCNSAQFVTDVTIPDGTVLSPGAGFTKTWRLKNIGTCTWTTSYDLVFSSGDSLSGPAAVDLPGNVAPGQVIDLSVNLAAPNASGSYRGDWKLRDSAGVIFGLGKTNATFYVDIKVASVDANAPLNFITSACLAEWSSGAGSLPCPGTDNDSRGFVMRVDKPVLESGYVDDEPALLTHPQMVTDGIIRGKYPAVKVKAGDDFVAVIGCARDTAGCDVNFQLDYQIGDGSIKTLKTWHEVYDEKFVPVSISLASLEGQNVKFILTILSNGSSNKDRALWLAPRIDR
jgi:hypothetical protein